MITLNKIQQFLGIDVSENDTQIKRALSIDSPEFDGEAIGWSSDKNLHLLKNMESGNVLISTTAVDQISESMNQLNVLAVENPRGAFASVLSEFFADKPALGVIESSAFIHESVNLDRDEVNIGHNVVIEADCTLGKRVVIGHNTVIKKGTKIGDDVVIGSNNTIGGVGFGYEKDAEGNYQFISHVGNVVIENNVDVGNNVCIDRAVMGSTFLRENVKVDNQVHIAHGVEVGKNSLVIAHVMVAGSVKIGENVWVAPSSSIRQKLIVNDDALIGLGSVVVKNVERGEIVAGVPAKPIKKK